MRNPFRRRKEEPAPPDARVADLKARLGPGGVPITEFPPTVTRLLRLYGSAGSFASMYRHQPQVRTVVDFIATEVAPLSIKLYERIPEGASRPASRIELDEHEFAALMRRPNGPTGNMTYYRLWHSTVSDIGVYDIAHWQKVRQDGRVRALLRIPPHAIQPERDPLSGTILRYRTSAGGTIELEDLITFPGYDPESNSESVSPLETLRRVLAEEWAAGKYREAMWRNAARREGVIERPVDAPPWDEDAREVFLADWEAAMTGEANSGRPAILEEGMTWKDSSFNSKEQEYLGARKLSRAEVCSAYHLPPSLVDGSPTKEDRTFFYVDRLAPLLERLQQELEVQLLPEFEPFDRQQRLYLEFNLDRKLRGSFEEQAAIASTLVGGPVVTLNEQRARMDLPPIPGGDEIMVPLNSVRGGGDQASPQSPTDTPAEGVNPAGTTPTPDPGESPDKSKSRLASDEMEMLRGPFVELHTEELRKFFERQRRVYKARAGAGEDPAFDSSRWDRELADDLQAMSLAVTGYFGRVAASKMDAEYDVERTVKYWQKAAEATARTINASTSVNLVDAEDPDTVFDRLSKTVAPQLALTKTQREMNWALLEAAHQAGA